MRADVVNAHVVCTGVAVVRTVACRRFTDTLCIAHLAARAIHGIAAYSRRADVIGASLAVAAILRSSRLADAA